MSEAIREILDTPGGHDIVAGFVELASRARRDLVTLTERSDLAIADVKYARGVVDGIERCIDLLKEWRDGEKKTPVR